MACSKKEFKDRKVAESIKLLYGKGGALSYSLFPATRPNSVIITPHQGRRIKTKVQAYKAAQSMLTKIKEEFGTKYRFDVFGHWGTIIEGVNDYRVEIKIPENLANALQAKANRKQAAIEHSRNLSYFMGDTALMEQEGYSEADYLVPHGPDTPDGINYGLYVNRKETLRDYVNSRIEILQNKNRADKNSSKADLVQVESLKEVARKLSKDLVALKSESQILTNFFEYFENDIDLLRGLLTDPTIENIAAAREFLDTINFVTETEAEGFSETSYTDFKEEFPEAYEIFKGFKEKTSIVQDELTKAEKEYIIQSIETEIANKKEGHDAEKIREIAVNSYNSKYKQKFKDISWVNHLFYPIDHNPNQTPFHVFIRKTYDDSMKDLTNSLRQKLTHIQAPLEKRLKELGHKTTGGIIGKLYNTTDFSIFKKESVAGQNRLIGKFSQKWDTYSVEVNKLMRSVKDLNYKSDKTAEDFTRINNLRNEHYQKLKHAVNFVDVTRIPELLQDADLQEDFGTFFSTVEDAESYKTEIIDQIGEIEYNRLISSQKDKMYSFQISMTQYRDRLMKEHGVESVTEVPETDYNKFLHAYYTQSPFAFSDSHRLTGTNKVGKVFFKDGAKFQDDNAIADLEYSTYFPKKELGFFDSKFAEIEQDPILYEAWGLMREATSFINLNGHHKTVNKDTLEDSLPHQSDKIRRYIINMGGIKGYTQFLSTRAMDFMKHLLSTSNYVNPDEKLVIQGAVTTIDQKVSSEMRPRKAVIAGLLAHDNKIDFNTKYTFSDLPGSVTKYIQQEIGPVPAGEKGKIEDFLRRGLTKKIYGEQQFNLIDTLNAQLELTQVFKAKKEVETKLNFFQHKVNELRTEGGAERNRASAQVKEFINANLYSLNNRANWSFKTLQKEEGGVKMFNHDETTMRNTIKESIDTLEKIDPFGKNPKIQAELASLNAFLETGGRSITSGSVVEAVALKARIFVGLGLNFTSQIKNYAVGALAGKQNDGLEWTEGNYYKAKSYTRKWKIATRQFSTKQKKNYKLTNSLIHSLGVFQNAANEIDKMEESRIANTVGKVLTNPLHVVGEVEKTIQRPQILALLGDTFVEDANGNQVPVFDVNDMSNPHPAFELDANDNLKLKDEFNTEENRDTWINRNSAEYVELFGESGKVPVMIAKINGDYRDSSKVGAKTTTVGGVSMLFKSWLPAYIARRYHPEYGVVSGLVKNERGTDVALIRALNSAVYGAVGATTFFNPAIVLGIVTGGFIAKGVIDAKIMKESVKSDASLAMFMAQAIKKELLSRNFYLKGGRLIGAGLAKTGQQLVNNISGKYVINNDLINKIAGYEGYDDVSKARLQFMLTELAETLIILSAKVLVQAFLFPDDEEEKAYRKLEGMDRILKEPDMVAYYALENLTSQYASDINLHNDPLNMVETILSGSSTGSLKDLNRLTEGIEKQIFEGDYSRGENAGDNRIVHAAQKLLLPGGALDYSLGFGKISRRDYRPSDILNQQFQSDFKTMEKNRLAQRALQKAEYQEKYKDRYKSEEKVEKFINKKLRKEFPSIKKYFKANGELKDKYKSRKKLDKFK